MNVAVPGRGRPARMLVLGLVVGLLLGCAAPASSRPLVSRAPDPEGYVGGSSLPEPYRMPNRSLTDSSGQAFNLLSSPSRPVVLLFFGYVNCPDVCVGVLSDLALALQRLEPGTRDHIQVLVVTTDPARDTPAALRTYLDRFDPTFIGLTGDLATIKAVAGQVGVDIEGTKRLPSGGYEVGHSAHVIGFDADRRGVVIWTPGVAVGDLKHDLGLLAERSR